MRSAVLSSFKTTGQRCVSSERLIVHEDIYEAFKDRFVALARGVSVDDPLDEGTLMGPLIEAAHAEKVTEYNDLARRRTLRCWSTGLVTTDEE